jgi:hypothetical protein
LIRSVSHPHPLGPPVSDWPHLSPIPRALPCETRARPSQQAPPRPRHWLPSYHLAVRDFLGQVSLSCPPALCRHRAVSLAAPAVHLGSPVDKPYVDNIYRPTACVPNRHRPCSATPRARHWCSLWHRLRMPMHCPHTDCTPCPLGVRPYKGDSRAICWPRYPFPPLVSCTGAPLFRSAATCRRQPTSPPLIFLTQVTEHRHVPELL